MDNVLKRRSVRTFDLSKKIDYNTLRLLCEAAEEAPSARNQKSRSYIIIDDENIIKELAKASTGAKVLTNCNTCIAIIGNDSNNLVTPHMQNQDLACATENILIAATSLNIGSCYIGIYPLEDRVKHCNRVLNVSDGYFTFSIIGLGYPLEDNVFYQKNKLSEDMLHYNRW